MKLSEHFSKDEFCCKHCGLMVEIDQTLIDKLELLRHELGDQPISINSGYRCPEHNKAIGGATNSYHVKGMAADIKSKGKTPEEIAKAAAKVGFNGIGVYKTWVHVDTREAPARW